ncbi:family 20 glycosylhydrolase [Streptacidiphilus monticola]
MVAAWLDASHGTRAVARGRQVVMAPHRATYLDYRQTTGPDEPSGHPEELLTLADVHAFDPLAGGLPAVDPALSRAAGVVGAQAQLWTEDTPTVDHLRYQLYPRLCAFAESAWSGSGRPGFADFRERLDSHLGLLARLGALAGPGPRWTGPDAVPVLEPEQQLSPETMGR